MKPVERSDANHFVAYLHRLHREKNSVALAHLRRGIDNPLGEMPERDAYLFRCPAVASADRTLAEAVPLIAGLFAMHPSSGKGQRLGSAAQLLGNEPQTTGIERRFIIMLESDRSELATHLRGIVSALKARGIALDWKQLTLDVMAWSDSANVTQHAWARQFWASSPALESRAAMAAENAAELVEQNA